MATLGTFVAGQVLTAAELNDIGTWTDFSGSVVTEQSVALTRSSTYAKYAQLNDMVIYVFRFVLSSAGTGGQPIRVSLPVAHTTGVTIAAGNGSYFDTSATTAYTGVWYAATTTRIELITNASGSSTLGTTPNITAGSGDILRGICVYEVG